MEIYEIDVTIPIQLRLGSLRFKKGTASQKEHLSHRVVLTYEEDNLLTENNIAGPFKGSHCTV